MSEQHYCIKCNRTLDSKQFYTSKRIEKYPPSGQMNICKKCLTMHVDNWDPETYKWILEEIDVPYIKEEWNNVLLKYKDNPEKLTGMTVLGRYLSKMKLKQWSHYHWEDTERLEQEAEERKTLAMRAQGFAAEDIEKSLAIDNTPARPVLEIEEAPSPVDLLLANEEPDEYEDKLTDEDKEYLRLKWGKSYRAEEWVRLEQLYQDMMNSYDIQTAGHKDTLIMLCKTSLKANQLLDACDRQTMST